VTELGSKGRGASRGDLAESGVLSMRALCGLFATALVAGLVAVSLSAARGGTAQPQGSAGPLSWLASELGPRTDSAPLHRVPTRGVHVDLRAQGFDFAVGNSRVALRSNSTGVLQPHTNGVSRTTPFGRETITVTPAQTELYDTVVSHQGKRTWKWNLESSLTPELRADGSILFAGTHPITVAPVKIYGPGRVDVTPAGARWSLQRAGSAWNLKLALDDAGLPVPYVIDPAISASAKPSPLLRTVFADGATGIWSLGEASPGGTAPNLVTGPGANGGDGTYAASDVASAPSLVNDSDAAASFTGASPSDNTVSNVSVPNVTTPRTVLMWLKSSSDGASPQAGLFSNRPGTGAIDVGLDGGYLFGYINGPFAPYWITSQRVNDGEIHFVAYTNDGTEGCLYVDGVADSCQAQAFPVAPPTSTAYVGYDESNAEKFSGTIDNVAIFDTTLTASQIAGIYSAAFQFGLTLDPGSNTFAAPPAATGPSLFYKPNASATFTVTENTGDATTTSVAPGGPVTNLNQPGAFTGAGAGPWSGAYSIGAGLTTEVTPTVRITNPAGTADGTFTLTPDATAPTGGALTVNGTVATSGGSTSTTTDTGFAIDGRTDYAEAASATESGLASSTLVRQQFPFLNDACDTGTLESTVTITGTTNAPAPVAGKCYVYTLTGTDNVGNTATLKTTVDVAGTASTLAVSAPASVSAGSQFSVTVTAKDPFGNTALGYTGTVHFDSSDPAAVLPADYTFTGADGGNHTFTDEFSLQHTGSKTINATDTVTPSINGTATVTVTASGADHLVFVQQPTSTTSGATIAPAVTVQILDQYDNPTTSTDNVTVAIKSGTGASGATLSGTVMVAAVSGTATFNDLSIDKAANGYALHATNGALQADSTTFAITPGAATHLVITSSTDDLTAGTTRTLTTAVKDANENTVTSDNTTSVTFAKQAGTGTVSGLGSATAVNGVASKTVTGADPGSITIAASAAGLTTGTTTFNVIAAPAPATPASGAPTPKPVFQGADPADGSTVASANTITLTASAYVYWTQLSLRFDPASGAPSSSTSLNDSGDQTTKYWIGATNPGLYTLSGFMLNGGGKVPFTTHFTVFTPAQTGSSSTTARSVSSTGGGTLVTAAGTERVTWTPGAFPVDAVELRVEPRTSAAVALGNGFTLGARTLSVTLVSSNGSLIHELNAPIEIVIDGATEADVPAMSDDGTAWQPLGVLPDHTLPAGQVAGYWREQLGPTTYRIHIWTRHLTLFGLLRDANAPSAPTNLTGAADASGVSLRWDASTDNSGTIASYVVAINGSAVKTVAGSQTSATVAPFLTDETRVYQVLAVDAAGNMSSLSPGVVQVPTVLGLSLTAATAALAQRGFTVGKVVQDAPGESATATVTAQSVQPPALVPVGSAVDLSVSVATGHAQLVVLTYSARKLLLHGTRYVELRVKVTVPVGLTAFLAGPLGRRYARWDRHLDAGLRTPRFAVPAEVKLVKGRPYHLEMYFSGGGQRTGLRRTAIH
jgi:hypothetical protein